MISLLIPVYNEKEAITETLQQAHSVLSGIGEEFEIVVINDGSTDGTTDILKTVHMQNLRVIKHDRNHGYGASMKTGVRRAKGNIIATVDADGTYPIAQLPSLLHHMREHECDMVVGSRTKPGAQIPFIRRPAKAIVAWLANTLVGMKIPDNNSGMRIFKRELVEEFMHLYPRGFSFTLTITLAALTNDYIVAFVPIDYFKRQGTSSLSSGMNGLKNFVGFLGIVVRVITYFRPLRFFAWPSLFITLFGIGSIVYTIMEDRNVSDLGILLLITGLLLGIFGLLADIAVRNRR